MSFQPKMLKSFKKAKSEFKREYDSNLAHRVDGLFDSLVDDLQTQLTDSPASVLVPNSGVGHSSQSLSYDAENEELARELFGDDEDDQALSEVDVPLFTELDWSSYLESTAVKGKEENLAVKRDAEGEAVPSSDDDDDDDDGGIQFVSTRQQYTFSCPFTGCWAAFTSNRHLNEHKKALHLTMAQPAQPQQTTTPVQGEKRKRDVTNYECPFPNCSKLFRSAQERLNHARVHTGARPYLCTWKACPYTARQLGHMTTHVRIVHFGLPKSQKEQQERGIVDDRDPRDFIMFRTNVD